ncbi:hypothetical protein Nepgr_030310 [Nepenthes gracilis]|uniref:FAF domain-containing protein n=1 Tax=Nepenthes gracilis TaxID=150966 RepID=A0AAD3Y3S6_NEPGR|nr:hypothetical protein Nepgr_030310 [Nepenthes gracilis]
MSTTLSQGVRPCYGNQQSLRLSSPALDFSHSPELSEKSTAADYSLCGWGSVQALCSRSSWNYQFDTEEKDVYIHPLIKRSLSLLSEKSLEMCTENLGSETGASDAAGSDIFSLSGGNSVVGPESPAAVGNWWKSRRKEAVKEVRCRGFPPPLTTLTGSNPIGLRAHRESGRLVINVFPRAHPRVSCLHAERSHGHLRLSFVKCYSYGICFGNGVCDGEVEGVDECGGGVNSDYTVNYSEDDGIHEREDEVSEEEEEEEEEEGTAQEEEQQLETGAWSRKDIDGINSKVGVKMETWEFQKPSSCTEDGRGSKKLIHWGQIWVATS